LILVVALVIFGPKKLPELGKMAGKAIRSARSYLNGTDEESLKEQQAAASAAGVAQTVQQPATVIVDAAPAPAPVEEASAAPAPEAAPIAADTVVPEAVSATEAVPVDFENIQEPVPVVETAEAEQA